MTNRIRCTACGGEVPVRSKASKTASCPYCTTTLIVNRAAVEAMGKFALLSDTPSCLAVGWPAELGGHTVHVLGRIQYQHDAGYWDEWWVYVPHKNAHVWISQDEGEYMLETPVGEGFKPPEYDAVSPGDTVRIGKDTLWVEEKNAAEMVGMQGELPLDAAPGRAMRFLDLTDNASKATIEYFEDGSFQAFRGRYLKPSQLRAVTNAPIDPDLPTDAQPGPPPLDRPEGRSAKAMGKVTRTAEGLEPQSVSCPNCAGSVMRHDTKGSVMVKCKHCRAALDVSVPGAVNLLYKSAKGSVPMHINIGDRGTIRGVEYTAIGRIAYEQRDGGIYTWRAVQLFHPTQGYAFLEEENGHWMFFTPLRKRVSFDPRFADPGDTFSHQGQRYRVHERGGCKITCVEGELTWVAREGDSVEFMDATCPPYMLSAEWTMREIEWEMGVYMTPGEVCSAFQLAPSKQTRPTGVAPAQPFVRSRARARCTMAGVAAGVLLVAQGALAWGDRGEPALDRQTVSSEDYLSDAGYLSPAFEIPEGSHICKLSVSSDHLNNAWVAFSVALLDAEDETVLLDAETEIERYAGRTGGESWSEGSRRDSTLFRLEGPRSYRLNIFGQAGKWSQSGGDTTASSGPSVSVALNRGVTPMRYYIVAALLAFAFPTLEISRQVLHHSRQSPETDD